MSAASTPVPGRSWSMPSQPKGVRHVLGADGLLYWRRNSDGWVWWDEDPGHWERMPVKWARLLYNVGPLHEVTTIAALVRVHWTDDLHTGVHEPQGRHLLSPFEPESTLCGVLVPRPVQEWVCHAHPVPAGAGVAVSVGLYRGQECTDCARSAATAAAAALTVSQWHALALPEEGPTR